MYNNNNNNDDDDDDDDDNNNRYLYSAVTTNCSKRCTTLYAVHVAVDCFCTFLTETIVRLIGLVVFLSSSLLFLAFLLP